MKVLFLVVGLVLLPSCLKKQEISADERSTEEAALSGTSTLSIGAEGGAYKTAVDPSIAQLITLNDGDLEGSSINIPAGSLAIDTEIEVKAGDDFGEEPFNQLGLDGSGKQAASKAIVIDSSTNQDAQADLEVSVPVIANGNQLLQASNLVVMFHIYDATKKEFRYGVVPSSGLILNNSGFIAWETKFFGLYQAFYLGTEVDEVKQVTVQESFKKDDPRLPVKPSLVWASSVGDITINEEAPLVQAIRATGSRGIDYGMDSVASTCDDKSWALQIAVSSSGYLTGTPSQQSVGACLVRLTAAVAETKIFKDIYITVTEVNDAMTWTPTYPILAPSAGDAISAATNAPVDPDGGTLVFSIDATASTCSQSDYDIPYAVDPGTGAVSGQLAAVTSLTACTIVVKATKGPDALSATVDVVQFPALPAGFACDDGTIKTTCNITTVQGPFADGAIIGGAGSLVIKSGGEIQTNSMDQITIGMGDTVTVEAGGKIAANATILAEDLEVQSGGTITASGLGHAGGNAASNGLGTGAGGGSSGGGGGGAHGGPGGAGGAGSGVAGTAFGNLRLPLTFGSGGGGGTDNGGGAGGGIIVLDVKHTVTVDGFVGASGLAGEDSGTDGGGGGAGGFIKIKAKNLVGIGLIKANGGAGGQNPSGVGGGSGGGGRVYFDVENHKYSGDVAYKHGGMTTDHANNGIIGANGTFTSDITNICDEGDHASDCTISLEKQVGDDTTLAFSEDVLVDSGGKLLTPYHQESLSITTPKDLTVNGEIKANATISAANLTIGASGQISADGKGNRGGHNNSVAAGPGSGGNNISSGGGASHAGAGATGAGAGGVGHSTPYSAGGCATVGSGGGAGSGIFGWGGFGGGSVELTVGAALIIDGVVSAKGKAGESAASGAGGGSGGSVCITTDAISGSGSIAADGGSGGLGTNSGGSGGGGSIEVVKTSGVVPLCTVNPGVAQSGTGAAGAGTTSGC